MNFGEYLKEKRLEKGVSLREFATQLDIAASYLSDIEKNRRNAPDIEKLNKIIKLLSLNEKEKNLLFDLAGESRDEVPPDLPEYINSVDEVKVLLRMAKNNNLTADDIQKMIDSINNGK